MGRISVLGRLMPVLLITTATLAACAPGGQRQEAQDQPVDADLYRAPPADKPLPPPPPPPGKYRIAPDAAGNAMAARDRAVMSPAYGAPPASMVMPAPLSANPYPEDREKYPDAKTNPVKEVAEDPVSTFSADVDTASYSNVRRMLNDGTLPPKDAVRVEEMVNYFDYHYDLPPTREQPFQPTVAVYPTPWNAKTEILHVGIQGYGLPQGERPPVNLTLLIDVSGSMNEPNKLPLLQKSLTMLVKEMTAKDRIAIVVYAGHVGVVLEPTPGDQHDKIDTAIDQLQAGGSTAGGEGIRRAYELAERSKIEGGVNRVMLATDGDFNVGITDPKKLEDFVARERDSGVTLTVLGFGVGNYNDTMMQTLAQAGNGNAAYIDTLNEARKVLVDEMAGTIFPIANDVKFQVEFNPRCVSEYRLIGYETRMLARQDFNNDKVDAGDIGAGHRVTALYEITPVGSGAQLVDPLRYGPHDVSGTADCGEIAYLKMRYKLPGETSSKLIQRPIVASDVKSSIDQVSPDMKFAVSVAGFGEILRGDPYLKSFGYDQVLSLAQAGKGDDPFGYRAEFMSLVRLAQAAGPLPRLSHNDEGGDVVPN